MDGHIVASLTWYDDDIHPDLREVRLYDAAVMGIVGLPFLTHEEIIGRADTRDEFIGTVTLATRVVSIADILCIFCSIDHLRIDPTSREPRIDHGKIVVTISWISSMVILSFSLGELDIPIMSSRVESSVPRIILERQCTSRDIVPAHPCRAYTIHIYSWNIR